VFKRMLSAFGGGGLSVDTVLDDPSPASPGEVITGRVSVQGGTEEAVVDQVVLSLATQVVVHRNNREVLAGAEFGRQVVRREVRVPAGEHVDVPFELALPWETPITAVGDAILPGMTVGLQTELVIRDARDKGDLDTVLVRPLPSQDRVLDAFGQLGSTFRSANAEEGKVPGVPQRLPFYQDIEFLPPPHLARRIKQVALTFVTDPRDLWVVLEVDKRSGMFRPSGKPLGYFPVSHEEAGTTDWTTLLGQWLQDTADGVPRENLSLGGGE
jgi:sporulation-control protein